MSVNNNSNESKPVYKYFRGKWKELGSDNKNLPRIEETEYDVKDLKNKSVIELEELIFRQEKLLQNKLFLSKLKDSGTKIKKKYDDLQKALKIVKEQNDSKTLEVNNHQHCEDIDNIEWNGIIGTSETFYNKNNDTGEHVDDCDDENINPLQLLARHSVEYPCGIQKRREDDEDSSKIIEKELEKLNLEDSEESSETNLEGCNDSSDGNFGQKLLNTLKEKEKSSNKRELFKPYRPRNSNTTSDKTVKIISLEESLKLLCEANKKEQMKNYMDASEALKNSISIDMTLPSSSYLNYRDANNEGHILDEDEEEEEETNQFLYLGDVED